MIKQVRVLLPALGLVLAMAAPSAAAEPWREKVIAFAAKNFQQGHTYGHSRRDYVLAKNLAAADHVAMDEDVIFAAAYLHDMGSLAPWADTNRAHGDVHGDVGAAKIDLVLADTDFPKAKLDAVRAAIRTHMFNRDPGATAEARYLHDADTLDNLGASGVASLLVVVDANGGKPTAQQLLKNFDNTKPIEKGVITPAGKAQLAIRVAEQKAFLDALRAETENFSNL
jgi:uncharacterized protein